MSLDGLDDMKRRFAAISDTRQMLNQLAILAVSYGKELVPRKTGNLGRTIRVGAVTADSAQILAGGSFGVGYARAVEFGSRPHVIRPRNKRVLAWGGSRRLSGTLRSGSQATSFAMFVNHPGARAKPYLVPGAQRAMSEAAAAGIIQAWNEAA